MNPWANKVKATEPEVVVTPAPAVEPASKLQNMFAKKPAQDTVDPVKAPGHTDLMVSPESIAEMDLSDLENSEDEGIAPEEEVFQSRFDDETPASKPTRELPEGLDPKSMQFVDLINGVYDIIGDTELLGGVIRSIMVELKSNPQYTKLIAPEDVRTWVRAMRDNMGLARIKKTEKKAKTGGSKSKSKDSVADQIADDLGIDWDNV